MDAWIAVAAQTGMVLYLPALAVAEVWAVYPDAESDLTDFLAYPSVVYAELSRVEATKVAGFLAESRAWDGTAGHVILVARQRGWPVLTTDSERLQRLAPDLDVDLL